MPKTVRGTMTDGICNGAMLVAKGIPLPESIVVPTKDDAVGWQSIPGSTSAQLGKAIENAGWTFFYMAGEIHIKGFGFDEQSRTDHAVARVMAAVALEKCNCFEITQIRQRSFLGIRYASLIARARHIQKSCCHDGAARVRFDSHGWLTEPTPNASQ